ncbi:UNVERIFIED_CONTAM: hypothetical protein Cloal_2053 [Acetivibrio alkalicellulosi]
MVYDILFYIDTHGHKIKGSIVYLIDFYVYCILGGKHTLNHRFSNNGVVLKEYNGVELLQFNKFLKYNNITHCFTTRNGGVSKSEYQSLNMAFNKSDDRKNVEENYKRVAKSIDIDIKNMVFSNQVHDSKIRVVNEDDRGKGIIRESDIIGFDGLVTNVKNVALVTFYADCVPVFLFDPVKTVISLVHSGWRGTVKNISVEAVKLMKEEYGSIESNIEVIIGPSIGRCCFEVEDDALKEFEKNAYWSELLYNKDGIKWKVDLQSLIIKSLIYQGLRDENIFNCKICTKCNKDMFFSHRGHKGKTGTLAAIMQIN